MNEEIGATIEKIKAEPDFFKKAKLIESIKKDKRITLQEVASKIGLKPSYVSHILRLLKLPNLILDGYYSQLIPLSHLFIIARLNDQKQMIEIYEKVLSEDLTTIKTEELVREALFKIKDEGTHISKEEISEFIRNAEKEGMTVRIVQTRVRGKLVFEIDGNLARTSTELRRVMEVYAKRQRENGEKA
ncbi:hypothetical protein HYT33_00735 [Candidatus Roizmanbacteria bacterium]|nr:hypothetical protein [Candidatus Roizmanbacteria bacterium]